MVNDCLLTIVSNVRPRYSYRGIFLAGQLREVKSFVYTDYCVYTCGVKRRITQNLTAKAARMTHFR